VRIVSTDLAAQTFCDSIHLGLAVCVPFHPSNNLSYFIRAKLEACVVNIWKFLKDENGATAIEYGLIAAGISIAIIVTVNSLGAKLVTTFGKVDTALN